MDRPRAVVGAGPYMCNDRKKEKNMKKLTFDTGVQSYALGEGVLRFNPADPNVYARFSQAAEKLQALEKDMATALSQEGADILSVMEGADRQIKKTLSWVFGPGNDFDALLGGVNLLASTRDGSTVASGLFAALEPVLMEGAQRCAGAQAAAIREKK